MPTIQILRSETRSTSIQADPQTVFDFVADPRTLPQWAPRAAKAVRPDGDHWILENGEGETRIAVRASREHGTVDLLSADDPRLGVFTRVLPNGDGSEYQFTLFFPPDTPDDAIAAQMEVVEGELAAVRDQLAP